MFDDRASFLSRTYLQSMLDFQFRDYLASGRDEEVLSALKTWHGRNKAMTETQAEQGFIEAFFVKLWGHGVSGVGHPENHTIYPKYPVERGGAGGNKGAADLALGWFRGGDDAVPQVLCEFKDIRSKLDLKQNRKGANMSPTEQCLNYLRAARRNTWGNVPVQPWWGLVTDMNEFRLYWWDSAPQAFMRFTISTKKDLFENYDLLSDGKDAQFDRFLFTELLHRDSLLSVSGKPELLREVERQGQREHKIEEEFYDHYKDFRDRLFDTLKLYNKNFPGTQTELLRISQRLLDRFIFAFYCEDMGERMLFPPQFIKDELMDRSRKAYYETDGNDIWEFMKRLFSFMNTGGKFGQQAVPLINGGLFADNPLIDNLVIPNFIFAAASQGANEASILKDKRTLLFLSAYYNYAAKSDATQSLTLYTLGRIFEQSITELEYRVGEIEGRDTIAKLSKRKRDGVYYTPEWVVNYLVKETMGPWFVEAREKAGWIENEVAPTAQVINSYLAKLRAIKVIDPACGSGAFLISAFRKLLEERKLVAELMQQLALKDAEGIGTDEALIIADILKHNLFGVDINPASVEIAKLALWLHSARARAPLSALDGNIVCGNSLVASDFWLMKPQTPELVARVNPFDWEDKFDEGSFDIVLGNPPYVKLQNLMKVDKDTVAYLKAQRPTGTYESTQTGNFDLYLPFIEKGLRLLREGGRMAYIAPSLWTVNEYGE
ncbi:MAG: N-6 DNA methylase, partial [Alphaproteobacteria bacterium]|nr:N-6 DNA methylase [Alphaproteobacteria bacterium]